MGTHLVIADLTDLADPTDPDRAGEARRAAEADGADHVSFAPGPLTGLPPEWGPPGSIVEAHTVAEIEACAAAGRTVLVSPAAFAGPGCDETAETAAAAICAWAGARIFRTRRVTAVRQALDMTAAIRGDRPPALTRRGLA
ncbi:hypothetical protein [Rhizohabitans arisaemae]|uniref:hypothetical protein n=1 Tax=Rhizohabitans arisaemae TaxID=2720610 RepID=UPI0024B08753|nr:hypothetical protein [Rhizohabitans arisaemae]